MTSTQHAVQIPNYPNHSLAGPRRAQGRSVSHTSETLATDVVNQVANAAGVSPFVVIPGNYFDAVASDHARHLPVHDGGTRVTAEVCGNELLLLITEVVLQRAVL